MPFRCSEGRTAISTRYNAFATGVKYAHWEGDDVRCDLSATTEPHDLLAGLERLRLPHQLVQIMGFMIRYLDVVTGELRRKNLDDDGAIEPEIPRDTFDPKARVIKEHGPPIKIKVPPTQFNNVGTVLKSPWEFRRYGQSGIPVSDLFPHVRECVDDLCVIRSMVGEGVDHPR